MPAIIDNSTIFFSSNWEAIQTRPIKQGGEITIFYDPMRLDSVYESESRGARDGMIYLNYQFDLGETIEVPILKQYQASGRPVTKVTPLAVTIDVPHDTSLFTVWFRGCRVAYRDIFDSNNTHNYIFHIT